MTISKLCAWLVYMMLGMRTWVTQIYGTSTDGMIHRNFYVVSEVSFGYSLYSSLYNKHYME